MQEEKEIVYVPMIADYLHHGHINIINEAKKYGSIIIGLMTDEAASRYKRLPLLSFDQRKIILEALDGVDKVVAQSKLDYVGEIRQYNPKYFVHGDDWKQGALKLEREKVIKEMNLRGGFVIEPEFTKGISSTEIIQQIHNGGIPPQKRLGRLKSLINVKKYVRGIEAHNGLTGLIAENAKVEKEGRINSYDFLWLSSLTDSTAKGKPDIELVDITSRLRTINDILDVTTLPIVYDADTGGKIEHFPYLVSSLSRLGVSACVIEDKTGLKRNSLFGNNVAQTQEDPAVFAEKIRAGKSAASNSDFMVIARIESLILEAGVEDAFERANIYIDAGADGIMIHSRNKDAKEIKEFCDKYNHIDNKPPLVLVPSSYNSYYEDELSEMGANLIIYANQLLRSAYPAMVRCANQILENERSLESDKSMMSIKQILDLIPGV